MGELVSLANKTDDSTFITPEQLLEEALKDMGSGDLPGKKALLIVLDESDGGYSIRWRNAGMKASELVSLCEAMKMSALSWMGYV